MKKSRDSLGHHPHVPAIASFIQVLSKSSTLQRVTILLEDMHIIMNSLLNEDCKKCGKEAKGEGHEPESVYTDVRCQWIEHRERRWWSGRDGDLWGNGR